MPLIHLLTAGLLGFSVHASDGTNYLDLSLRQNRYMGDVQSPLRNSNYTLISADLSLEAQSPGFNYRLNPVARGTVEYQDEFYFGVPEAYVQPRKIAPGFNLTIGRQKRTWSRLDEEFNLGVWQPQLRWDYLAPAQQGLTGVFFDWSLYSNLNFTFFTSPLHIPDQGPQYRLQEGRFSSSNRWFYQPTSRMALFPNTLLSSDAPLYFQLDRPTEEELVMHSSFGLGLQYQPVQPFWTQLSYAYKPRNQIHLGLECTNCVTVGAPVEIYALIHPKIVKHHVITWEMGFDRVDDRAWFSITGDVPNRSGFPNEYAESPLNPMVITGAAYQHYVRLFKPSWFSYAYMKTFDFPRGKPGGVSGVDQVHSSLERYPFKELGSAEWKLIFAQTRRGRFSWRNRYNYSVPEKGGWWSTSVELTEDALTWSLGADILGADVDSNSTEAGLFSRFRANDRLYGGVSYVF
jgi:hypothetical protein